MEGGHKFLVEGLEWLDVVVAVLHGEGKDLFLDVRQLLAENEERVLYESPEVRPVDEPPLLLQPASEVFGVGFYLSHRQVLGEVGQADQLHYLIPHHLEHCRTAQLLRHLLQLVFSADLAHNDHLSEQSSAHAEQH